MKGTITNPVGDHDNEAGDTTLHGCGPGAPDGTHPHTYGPDDSKRIIEDKKKQPGE